MDRFFPYEDGWQRLCLECNDTKTKNENVVRVETRRKKKERK
jgi:hypothetical protein